MMSEGRDLKRRLEASEDPDYVFDHDRKRRKSDDDLSKKVGQEARLKAAAKAAEIIDRNFSSELQRRESDLERLDSMILEVQKSLHLVRYAAVSSLYSGSNITGNGGLDVSIHPFTRKLLRGKKPKFGPGTESTPKPSCTKTSSLTTSTADSLKPVASTVIKVEPDLMPSYVGPKVESHRPESEPRGLQHKRKRRIIVGNVSKWIECDQREDLSTHKWMLYVRGSKDEPDLSDVVSKVRFLIHQSYHPNNLIEVTRPPFHLTRRGWGEFPARIQIHFKNEVDKPVDVVHNLKLDKTYTGLQTLGAETVVDVWLHADKTRLASQAADRAAADHPVDVKTEQETRTRLRPKAEIKLEPDEVSTKKENVASSTNDVGVDVQTTFIRCKGKEGGSFLLPVTVLPKNCQKRVDWNLPLQPQHQLSHQLRLSVELPSQQQQQQQQQPLQQQQQSLIKKSNGVTVLNGFKGRDHTTSSTASSLLKSSSLPAGTSLLRNKSLSSSSPTKPESLNWFSVLSGKRSIPLEDFEKQISRIDPNILHKGIDQVFSLRQKLLGAISSDFVDDKAFFMKIFKCFPLVTSSSASSSSTLFRSLLPFTARSENEFRSWPLTKQKASEWMRARTVQKALSALRGPKKTTKELLVLSRRLGLSILDYKDGNEPEATNLDGFSTFTPCRASFPAGNQLDTSDDVIVVDDNDDCDVTSDVKVKSEPIDDTESSSRLPPTVSRLILPDDNVGAMNFIEDSVKQLGFRTELEEVQPGVYYPLAQKCLLVACKNFIEEMLRRGHAETFRDGGVGGRVEVRHIASAVVGSTRLSFLTNQGLASNEAEN